MSKFSPQFPDFFIVGAPRCGTTSMSRYLSKHPHICFSKPKEPHFFSLILDEYPEADVQKDYLERFFAHHTEKHRVVGEGSVSYLYTPQSIERILRLNPDARFIVMVRNPVDLVYSYHSRLLVILDEDVVDLSEAWSLQAARARGEHIPKHCRRADLLQYEDIGKLGEQVEKLFDLVGAERCLVTPLEDLVRDPLAVYKRTLEFIGIEYDGLTTFKPRQENKAYRYRWLHLALTRPPKVMVNYMGALDWRNKRKAKREKPLMKLRKKVLHINTVLKPRPPLEPELRRQLQQTFAADVEKLGALIGRDLSHWQ